MKKIDWLKISPLVENLQSLCNQADIQAILFSNKSHKRMSLSSLIQKNMHFGHPQTTGIDLARQSQAMYSTLLGKSKPSYVY